MSADTFTPEEIRILKSLAAGMLKAMGREKAGNGLGGAVASDAELDGRYGDPTVRKDPKRWAGASYKGARYSECPSDYLESLAGYLEWCAGKDSQKPDAKTHSNGTPYWKYDLKNAALARGWAARNAGKKFEPPQLTTGDDGGWNPDDAAPGDYDQSEEWAP